MDVVSDVGPILPPELEQQIFEYAFLEFRECNIPTLNLMLVAQRVHDWVASKKYCLIVTHLHHKATLPQYMQQLSSVQYYGKYVKHLMMGGDDTQFEMHNMLDYCTNLVDLAILSRHNTSLFIHLLASKPVPVKTLFANLSSLTDDEIGGRAFSNVTHLDITHMGGGGAWSRWKVLTSLPQLTHLIVNEEILAEVVTGLLQGCKRLKLLLLAHNPGFDLKAEVKDHRLVLMEISRYVLEDWIIGVQGGENMLSAAEEISYAKQTGFRDCHTAWIASHRYRKKLMELGYQGGYGPSGN